MFITFKELKEIMKRQLKTISEDLRRNEENSKDRTEKHGRGNENLKRPH